MTRNRVPWPLVWICDHQNAIAWFAMAAIVITGFWLSSHQASVDRAQDRRFVHHLCVNSNEARAGLRAFIKDLVPEDTGNPRAERILDLAQQRFAPFDCPEGD